MRLTKALDSLVVAVALDDIAVVEQDALFVGAEDP
jgi:hypothetical protein